MSTPAIAVTRIGGTENGVTRREVENPVAPLGSPLIRSMRRANAINWQS